ncbi:hypothetical protein [Rathayibacter rathayi]|uniref:hypothetical protein n=1 Tax=Rathayibacter rathayi TaxID=33887 RepID=UPI0011AFEA09|nr:hypothetical protein [Rathayibacter rathayi]
MGKRANPAVTAQREAIIEAVLFFRDEAGLTNADIIRVGKFSVNYYYTRLRGEMPFDTDDLARIGAALGIKWQDIAIRADETLAAKDAQHAARIKLDGVELARRLSVLSESAGGGLDFTKSEFTPESWAYLIQGDRQVSVALRTITSIATFFEVETDYLTELSAGEWVDRIEAGLELKRSLHSVGAQLVSTRALAGLDALPPSALRAFARSIQSIDKKR